MAYTTQVKQIDFDGTVLSLTAVTVDDHIAGAVREDGWQVCLVCGEAILPNVEPGSWVFGCCFDRDLLPDVRHLLKPRPNH